ncbi:MAG: hypothetical protein QUS14_17720, partial [Pyrinomonadaceae bacterium]|nr:hypothetical protein [Pyrinomonadaceae bacterium]
MFSLQDLLGQDRGSAALGEIANNVGADGLGGLLGGLLGGGQAQQASSGNAMFDMASSMLDRDGDG